MAEGSRNIFLLLIARVAYFLFVFWTLCCFYDGDTFFLYNGQEESAREIWGGVVFTGIAGSITISLIKYALNNARKKIIDYSIIVFSILFYLIAII